MQNVKYSENPFEIANNLQLQLINSITLNGLLNIVCACAPFILKYMRMFLHNSVLFVLCHVDTFLDNLFHWLVVFYTSAQWKAHPESSLNNCQTSVVTLLQQTGQRGRGILQPSFGHHLTSSVKSHRPEPRRKVEDRLCISLVEAWC